jgi:hypothetical protein
LHQGDYAGGWSHYEKRINFRRPEQLAGLGIQYIVEKYTDKARWLGEDLKGKTLLVWTEQGLGDNIMMMRYLPLLKQKGAGSVIVYSRTDLVKIMLTATSLVLGTDIEVSKDIFDVHCSMMSLPALFHTTLQTVPADVPYLHIPDAVSKKWAAPLKKFDGLKVGFAWRVNTDNGPDNLRSIALPHFGSLVAHRGAQFFSLQKNGGAEELHALSWRVLDWTDACPDYLDLAALIDQMDLVICVDSEVAHIAGALGKRVWFLKRFVGEWCWGTDREDTPWYPTVRIFSQPTVGDWDSVLKAVDGELEKLAAGTPSEQIDDAAWQKKAHAADRALGISRQNGAGESGGWGILGKLLGR